MLFLNTVLLSSPLLLVGEADATARDAKVMSSLVFIYFVQEDITKALGEAYYRK